ncbi:DUF2330 domain-containing protein [Candidatus Parabeggiatoa sp. HSG14]|uniref:DUF2330 domain-containing protein n=1 Tax=Candidatus Parabeggiatoa sp. HSG14 TaxID=3055593 RepID=UPI0025A90861|nr:DUF2330 domain-containing protein [Thiotrichales bacterium HSG14]
MKKLCLITVLLSTVFFTPFSYSFCGFYVAKADAKLFNQASQVVLTRHEDKTVITMANDFQGDLKEFAVVIPVPTFIEKGQIHISNKTIIDHLDAYTAPRLVEYFDENPCMEYRRNKLFSAAPEMESATQDMAKSLGVTVEAQYTVGEYDIVILSATQSTGLETWLKGNGYRIPTGAAKVLGSYIRQNMRFFVAKVNLEEQSKLGFNYLRPISVAYDSPKFMLPIRLGTVNAKGPQELFIYTLTKKGRVETTNYRTVKLPTDMDLPIYIKNDFGSFYRAMFDKQVQKENMKTVFLEYAWDMNWCDPCAADPLSDQELRELGVFWLNEVSAQPNWKRQAKNVFVTRLHLRYTANKFPEDLVFQETADRSNFQGRYVLRHPWNGNDSCNAAQAYHKNLVKRQEKEAQMLASLTGWNINAIRDKIGITEISSESDNKTWWQKLWGR